MIIGPGAYNPDISPARKRSPEYSMGGKHSSERVYSDPTAPGPGAYQ